MIDFEKQASLVAEIMHKRWAESDMVVAREIVSTLALSAADRAAIRKALKNARAHINLMRPGNHVAIDELTAALALIVEG